MPHDEQVTMQNNQIFNSSEIPTNDSEIDITEGFTTWANGSTTLINIKIRRLRIQLREICENYDFFICRRKRATLPQNIMRGLQFFFFSPSKEKWFDCHTIFSQLGMVFRACLKVLRRLVWATVFFIHFYSTNHFLVFSFYYKMWIYHLKNKRSKQLFMLEQSRIQFWNHWSIPNNVMLTNFWFSKPFFCLICLKNGKNCQYQVFLRYLTEQADYKKKTILKFKKSWKSMTKFRKG